jgi:hypothetical protein
MTNDMLELAKEFIELDMQKKEHDANIDKIKKRMEEISPVLEDYMTNNDFTFKIGKATVYRHEQIWPKRKKGFLAEDVQAALKSVEGWQWLVKDNVNGHQLASAVRECINNGQELPAPIARVLDASATVKVKVRHS